MTTMLISLLMFGPQVSPPARAATTYLQCRALLVRADALSREDRARLQSVRDEYAELGRRLRRVANDAERNRTRMIRAAGEANLDKRKDQFDVCQRSALAIAALPVVVQLPNLYKVSKLVTSRDLSEGIHQPSGAPTDALSTIRDMVDNMDSAGRFYAALAERAEQVVDEANRKLAAP